MSDHFDAKSIETSYDFVDECPAAFLDDVVKLPFGSIRERVVGIRRWRDALLAGQLPPADGWPPPEVAAPVRRALEDLGIARFCRNQAELVDALLKDVLAALQNQSEEFQSEVMRRLRELEKLEVRRGAETQLDPDTLRMLQGRACKKAAETDRGADASLMSSWSDRVGAWREVSEVFGDLGEHLGRGRDLSSGILKHVGWTEVLRLHRLMEQLPNLREVVRALGRLQKSNRDPSVAERIFKPVRRLEEERREVMTPGIPHETRGVERSGDIARMLPVEATMLGHPKFRMLWHARRAERALLTYSVEGVEEERIQRERETVVESEGKAPRPERGPIVAVIDTSGSMNGLPEQIAKAIVLEAARTAYDEKRRCYLYAYSGPGQVIERELDLGPEGLGRLMDFLAMTFGGGTDIGAMSLVVQRLALPDWQKADVVLATDGMWSTPPEVAAAVARAKENGTRFHGIQIGTDGRTGLHEFCDPVHEFSAWAAAGGWQA